MIRGEGGEGGRKEKESVTVIEWRLSRAVLLRDIQLDVLHIPEVLSTDRTASDLTTCPTGMADTESFNKPHWRAPTRGSATWRLPKWVIQALVDLINLIHPSATQRCLCSAIRIQAICSYDTCRGLLGCLALIFCMSRIYPASSPNNSTSAVTIKPYRKFIN